MKLMKNNKEIDGEISLRGLEIPKGWNQDLR